MAKCIVLQSSGPYKERHAPLLRSLLDKGPDLFSCVGPGCESWEDAIDSFYIDLKTNAEIPEVFCNTTSHPDETLHEVIAFAEQWCDLKGWSRDVEVIKI